MQFATDVNLAAALDVGQKRVLGVKFMVDWNRDGLFSETNSDLSAFVDEWDSDRSLSGVIPSELQTTEGFLAGKLTVKLSGNLADGTPLWKMFSPYSGYGTYGTGGALNTPMYLQVIAKSPLGVWNIDQFTGWIDRAKPSRASGTVTITCLDGGGQLETGVTVDRWAADSYRREQVNDSARTNGGEASESGLVTSCWLIDSTLRRAGFYEGPQWHPQSVAAWTLRGSALPEIGSWSQITTWNFENTWSFGMGLYNTPNITPAMDRPGDVYSKAAGKYGPAFKGANGIGNWRSTGNRYMKVLHSGITASTTVIASSFGSNNSNIMGNSGWFFIDSTAPNDQTTLSIFYLSAFHMNFSGSDQYPANVAITVHHKTGVVKMEVNNEGATKNWSWTTTLTNGWHFVSGAVAFTPSQITGSLWVDTVNVVNNTNGGLVGGLGAMAYTWVEGATNTVYLETGGTAQYFQWAYAGNVLMANYVQPASTPPTNLRNTASVDLGAQRLHWFPNIENSPAGDTIQAATGADLGAFYFTEQGVATFDSRGTILGRQQFSNVAFDLTLDNSMDLAPESAYLSVANRIGYTAAVKLAEPYRFVYAASKPDQFLIPSGGTPRYPVTLSDVMQYRCGQVTFRPFAQGYDVGLSPPTLYWQSYMDFYKPAYWNDGYTAYLPGSRPSNGPPPTQSGFNVFALPGWANPDLNNRHLRIAISNVNANALEAAVDDSTPFLKVGGTTLVDRPTVVESTSDATSILRYRERVFSLPADDWHQDIIWLRILATSLLTTTKNPTTNFEEIETVGDPRRQLQDVCRVVDPDRAGGLPGLTGQTVAYGSVVGIKRQYTRSGDGAKLTDTLTIRVFA